MKVIALGFFDGLHLGHQALLKKACEIAKDKGAEPSVFTFDRHPSATLCPQQVPLINHLAARKMLIEQLGGISQIIVQDFNEEFANISWEAFVVSLQEKYQAIHLVCGHDFRFGHKGQGNTQNLARKCLELGLGLSVVEEVFLNGKPLCSSHIRKLLLAGEIEEANLLLGHPHILLGTVLHGAKLGSVLGTPTVNLQFPPQVLSLPNGVYATKVRLSNGEEYIGATSIGTRPTVEKDGVVTVESHILDFQGDLYGQEVTILFYHYLRGEVKFENLEALKVQIGKDIVEIREIFSVKEGD